MPLDSHADRLIAESKKLRAHLSNTAARLLAFSEELMAEVQTLREAGENDDCTGTGAGERPSDAARRTGN